MSGPWKIALEGPVCAGKTTLGRGLLQEFPELRVTYVVDYSEYVGGGRFLPSPVPRSLEEEEATLKQFLLIEEARTAHARTADTESGLILIDRSIHTLLAHCHSLQMFNGIDYFRLAQRVLQASSIPMWPNLILYLDATSRTIRARNFGKFPPKSIFVDEDFNSGIRLHFVELARINNPHVLWLDATADIPTLRRQGRAALAQWLERENVEEGLT